MYGTIAGDAEIMKKALLGDYITGYSVKNKKDEDIPVYSVTNDRGFCTEYFSKDVSGKDKSKYKIVPRGYFAYNPSRINVGSVDWQNREDRVIVSPLYVVFKTDERLEQEYLKYYLKSDIGRYYINESAVGAVRANLKLDILSKFRLPIPDIEEQKNIVSQLKLIDEMIELKEKEITVLDTMIKARFDEMFGDPSNPMGWNVVNVDSIADVQVGVVIKPSQYYTDKDSGTPAFRSLNIGSMCIRNNDWVYFTDEGHKKNSKSIIKENDLLIVRSGAPGTACVVTKEYEGYNAIDVIIAHPYTEKVNPYYLCAYTNFPHGKLQIDEGTGGAAQQHFNVGKYNKLKVMLPPISMQNKYFDFLKQVDKSKTEAHKAIEKLKILQKNLLQKYFC